MKKFDPDKYFTPLEALEPCFPLIEPCKPIEEPCRPIEVFDPCTPLDEDEMTARDWDLLNFLDINCGELFPYANYTLKMIDDMIQEIEICPDGDIIPKNLDARYKLPRMDYFKIFFKKNGYRKDIAVAKELLKLYVQSPEYIARSAQNVTYLNDLDQYAHEVEHSKEPKKYVQEANTNNEITWKDLFVTGKTETTAQKVAEKALNYILESHFTDKYAKIIFEWWVKGKGNNLYLDWDSFMKKCKYLREKYIKHQLLKDAKIRFCQKQKSGRYRLKSEFAANTGESNWWSGYGLLHGTTFFKYSGHVEIKAPYTLEYDLRFDWKDKIDSNIMEAFWKGFWKAAFLELGALCISSTITRTAGYSVKDYWILISWRAKCSLTFDKSGKIIRQEGYPLIGVPEEVEPNNWIYEK